MSRSRWRSPRLVLGLGLVVAVLVWIGFFRDEFRDGDERAVRSALGIPSSARLIRLTHSPDDRGCAGSMQREGLRIDASFRLAAADPANQTIRSTIDRTWPRGSVPAVAATFPEPPPADMLAFTGSYLCAVRVYRPNSMVVESVHSCADLPSRFDQYVLATYDSRTEELRVWSKNLF